MNDTRNSADILLRGGRIINVLDRTIDHVDIGIIGNRILLGATTAKTIIDLDGSFVSPGFIDAHMHVESTMLPPSSFAQLAVPHGTTAVVLDPHEIANVLGMTGIELIMKDSQGLPIDCFFTASSCVPASPLETSGATILAEDLAPLFEDDRVIALAEMMNYPGVINGDPEVLRKIKLGLQHGVVDGHCPGLRGDDLQTYINAGITSDHECTTAEEAMEKLASGMYIYIREGSAAHNLEALLPIVTPENAHRICFCTDDRHPKDLRDEGHIDHIVRSAIALGLDPILAFCISSLHVAEHYDLPDHGAIETGRLANLVIFDNLDAPHPRQTWHHGKLVCSDGEMVDTTTSSIDWSAAKNTVHLPSGFCPDVFQIRGTKGTIRVIGLVSGQLFTEELHYQATIQHGLLIANTSEDVLKIAVIERHHNTGNIGLGFVRGFQFQGGAIASSVGHDAHNIAVVSDNDDDMYTAAVALADVGGGQCVVSNGEIKAILPLPLAGLMSDGKPNEVILQQEALLAAVSAIGCPIEDPFMPLSFLPLSVIPKLKVSDLGLIDVDAFKIVPLQFEST